MCSSCNCFDKILKLLRSIHGSINDHMKFRGENYGLSTTEFMVMFEIYNSEGLSLNELSKMLNLPKSSVSRIVDQLVEKGIVDRTIPPENRRTVTLSIRPDFLKCREIEDINDEFNDRLKNIGTEKTEQIVSALEMLKSIFPDGNQK